MWLKGGAGKVKFVSHWACLLSLACVADETKPRYSPSANQRPKACSVPRVLLGFSLIGSNWLLHMAVLPCTMIGRVDFVEPWLRWQLRSRWTPDTQNKNDGDHGITCRDIIKTDSVQSSSNKCKNYLLKIYSQHIDFLNTIWNFSL